MHAGEFFLILILNCILIFVLYLYQKQLIEKSIKNLKKEIHELEDLVAAIIEEFEDIADTNTNKDQQSEISSQIGEFSVTMDDSPVKTGDFPVTSGGFPATTQGLLSDYPTVGDFLDNLEENDLQQMAQAVKAPKKPFHFVDEDNDDVSIATKPFHTTVEAVQETGEELGEDQPEIPASGDAGNKESEVVLAVESTKSSKLEGAIQLESVNDPRHRRILEFREQGMTVEDIARQLGTGRGEILLVLGLYRRN